MHADDGIAIGKVLRAWGRHGAVVVKPLTHDVRRFDRLAEVWVSNGAKTSRHTVAGVRYDRQSRPLIRLSRIETMNQAEDLRGATLMVSGVEAERPANGGWFNHELVGSEVVEADGRVLGTARAVIETAASNVLVVDGEEEILIPITSDLIDDVDVEAKRIHVSLPKGLVELNGKEDSSAV